MTDISMELVQRIVTAKCSLPGALLPILHDIQDALGYVPDEVVPLIAKELNLSRAEVHGVITYYHHFRRTPPGSHVVHVCCAEACQSVGSEALAAHARAGLKDRNITLEPVYCLGLCSIGPAIQIDEANGQARFPPPYEAPLSNSTHEPQAEHGGCRVRSAHPTGEVHSKLHARVTPEKFDALINSLGEKT